MEHEVLYPAFEALVNEQLDVQAGKFQGRQLDEYSRYIFTGQEWRSPRSSAVTDFLRPLCIDQDTVSLEGLLDGVYRSVAGSMTWVDMAGGRGLPMRELAARSETIGRAALVNVDLFDYGINNLELSESHFLESNTPGMTRSKNAPTMIRADVETVQLPSLANIITSVETMQYLNNPLAAIASWYNQLEDGGLLMVSTEHDWASWIRYSRDTEAVDWQEPPTQHLIEALEVHGIGFAASNGPDLESGYRPKLHPGEFRNIVIQKEPGTSMTVNSPVHDIWVNPQDFKAVYYETPKSTGNPLIEITSAY